MDWEEIKHKAKGYASFALFGLAILGIGAYIYVTDLIDEARLRVKSKRRSEG